MTAESPHPISMHVALEHLLFRTVFGTKKKN